VKLRVVVVGGGPCGLLLARLLSERGHEVLELEEHGQLGLPRHCTGLVSEDVYAAYGLKTAFSPPLSEFTSGELILGERRLRLKFRPRALALDREEFERGLGELARSSGVVLKLGRRVLEVSGGDGAFLVRAASDAGRESEAYLADFVVDCSGAKRGLPGLQYEVEGRGPSDPQVYFESTPPREYFYWVVPQEEGRYLVGTASRIGAKIKLDSFMSSAQLRRELEVKRVIRAFGGLVVVDPPTSQFSSSFRGALAAGDAANQVKLTTGGGLIFAAISAKALAESLDKGPEQGAIVYAEWFRQRKKEIKRYKVMRELYVRAPEKVLMSAFGPRVQAYLDAHPLPYDDHTAFLKEGALALSLDLLIQFFGLSGHRGVGWIWIGCGLTKGRATSPFRAGKRSVIEL